MPPRLSKIDLWKRHEERVCEVLAYALTLLQGKSELIQDEDELNRELFFCLREANAYFYTQGRGLETLFYPEARNHPSADHKYKHEREDKRPDFQNGLVDHTEADPQKQQKQFCIECKRLGNPPSRNWKINRNYVSNGIARYLSEQHGYGFDVESGAMVGYIESSDFDIILEEVNLTFSKKFPHLPQLPNGSNWEIDSANFLEHSLERNFPVSPFILKHFWIDLRGKLSPPSTKIKVTSAEESNTELEMDSPEE